MREQKSLIKRNLQPCRVQGIPSLPSETGRRLARLVIGISRQGLTQPFPHLIFEELPPLTLLAQVAEWRLK